MPTLYKPFKGNYPITSGYGNRKDPISGKDSFHNGIDFGVPANTPLYNLEDGVVTVAGVIDNFNPKSPNLAVGVKANSDGVVAVYMHINRIDVKVGQKLKGGDMIGLSGNTGYSTGPHLHFGLYSKLWNSTINPTFLLDKWVEVSSIENNMSDFKQKFLNGINTMGFDPDTQRTLTDATNGEDANYILAFSGKAIRDSQAQMEIDKNKEINSLQLVNQTLQNQIQDTRGDLVKVQNENAGLKNQIQTLQTQLDSKPTNPNNNLYLDQIDDLEEKLSDMAVENNQLKKQIKELKENNEFKFSKFFIGISKTIRERNLIAYLTYILAFVGIQLINYLSIQSQELGYSSIAVLIPILKDFFTKKQGESIKEIDPEIKKQIDQGLKEIENKLPKKVQL